MAFLPLFQVMRVRDAGVRQTPNLNALAPRHSTPHYTFYT